jgi:hypothetical protein
VQRASLRSHGGAIFEGQASCRYWLPRQGPREVKGTPRPRGCSVPPGNGRDCLWTSLAFPTRVPVQSRFGNGW